MSRSEVVLKRIFEASAEILYAAWTEPARMRRWLATKVETDTRVGGAYRLLNREEDGSTNVHVGEFQVLEPGRRIKQTFRHEGSPPRSPVEETLEVRLLPLGPDRTELTLIHALGATDSSPENQKSLEAGWNAWLDLLEGSLEESRK
jgi:uncharacterized protein YndB with AHSA1/START domain